jgi:hypothetical protein
MRECVRRSIVLDNRIETTWISIPTLKRIAREKMGREEAGK